MDHIFGFIQHNLIVAGFVLIEIDQNELGKRQNWKGFSKKESF